MSFPLSYARVGKICRQAVAASFKPEDKEDTKAVSFQSHGSIIGQTGEDTCAQDVTGKCRA